MTQCSHSHCATYVSSMCANFRVIYEHARMQPPTGTHSCLIQLSCFSISWDIHTCKQVTGPLYTIKAVLCRPGDAHNHLYTTHTHTHLHPHKSNYITPWKVPGNHPEKLKPLLCGLLSGKTCGEGLTGVPAMHGLPLHSWPLAVYDTCMEGILYFKGFAAANSVSMCLHACCTTASCGSRRPSPSEDKLT